MVTKEEFIEFCKRQNYRVEKQNEFSTYVYDSDSIGNNFMVYMIKSSAIWSFKNQKYYVYDSIRIIDNNVYYCELI